MPIPTIIFPENYTQVFSPSFSMWTISLRAYIRPLWTPVWYARLEPMTDLSTFPTHNLYPHSRFLSCPISGYMRLLIISETRYQIRPLWPWVTLVALSDPEWPWGNLSDPRDPEWHWVTLRYPEWHWVGDEGLAGTQGHLSVLRFMTLVRNI